MSDEILQLNQLDYSQPKIMNPSKKTEKIDIPINPNRYDECVGGEQIPIIFETMKPNTYIDGSKSSLSFQLQVNAPIPLAPADFAFYRFDLNEFSDSGSSVLNLFSDAQHQTENNQTLYRENYINVMQTFRNFRISPEHRQNLTMIGASRPEVSYLQTTDPDFPAQPIYGINKPNTFDIPFSAISPFWNTSQLLPAELLEKSALFLKVADPRLFLAGLNGQANTNTLVPVGTTVSFINISLKLHRTELYDNIQSAIKSSQLEFSYLANHNIVYQPTSTDFVIPVNLAAAKVSYVAVKFYKRDRVPTVDQTITGGASIYDLSVKQGSPFYLDNNGLNGIRIQAKIGEMLVPKFVIDTAPQAYILTCDALDRVPFKNTENPDPLKIINQLSSGTIPYNNYCFNKRIANSYLYSQSTGCFCVAINLQKYGGLSGLSTNANRLLALHIEGLTNFALYDAYVQVQYMSNVSMMENNIIVSK